MGATVFGLGGRGDRRGDELHGGGNKLPNLIFEARRDIHNFVKPNPYHSPGGSKLDAINEIGAMKWGFGVRTGAGKLGTGTSDGVGEFFPRRLLGWEMLVFPTTCERVTDAVAIDAGLPSVSMVTRARAALSDEIFGILGSRWRGGAEKAGMALISARRGPFGMVAAQLDLCHDFLGEALGAFAGGEFAKLKIVTQ